MQNDQPWVQCVRRQEVMLYDKDGRVTPVYRCAHQACSWFGKDLEPTMCKECPMRVFTKVRPEGYTEEQPVNREFGQPRVLPGGVLEYPKTGWEPPLAPSGYVAHPNDPWVMIPTWPPCDDRAQINSVKPCGCLKVDAVCESRASQLNGQIVTVDICRACPVRRSEQVSVNEGAV